MTVSNAFVAFLRPWLDQTDGSLKRWNNAIALGQLRYNLARSSEEWRESILSETRPTLQIMDEDFELS